MKPTYRKLPVDERGKKAHSEYIFEHHTERRILSRLLTVPLHPLSCKSITRADRSIIITQALTYLERLAMKIADKYEVVPRE